jgi:Tol biopolymer transport system component
MRTKILYKLPQRIVFLSFLLFSLLQSGCNEDNLDPLPKNGKIAFSSNREGLERIFTIDSDGKNLKKVTNEVSLSSQTEDYGHPSFSRDGKKLAFLVIPENISGFGIAKVNADGSDKRALGFIQNIEYVMAPTWTSYEDVYFITGSPSELHYYSGNTGIQKIDADEWCYSMFGCWEHVSPDACLKDDSGMLFGNGSNLYLINFNGTVTTLFSNIGYVVNPSYSPDGKKILWSNLYTIFVMDKDGRNKVELTDNQFNSSPVWSPDGTKIAFQSSRDGNTEIYVMESDGSNQTNITNNLAEDVSPSWGSK